MYAFLVGKNPMSLLIFITISRHLKSIFNAWVDPSMTSVPRNQPGEKSPQRRESLIPARCCLSIISKWSSAMPRENSPHPQPAPLGRWFDGFSIRCGVGKRINRFGRWRDGINRLRRNEQTSLADRLRCGKKKFPGFRRNRRFRRNFGTGKLFRWLNTSQSQTWNEIFGTQAKTKLSQKIMMEIYEAYQR